MNSTALSTTGVKAAVSALLAAAAFMALGLAFNANGAKASTVGDPVNPEFNYVGLSVTAAGNELSEIVLEPPTAPIALNGSYTDTNGNFTIPQDTGLNFPPVEVAIPDVATINGEIALTKDGTGNYNEATGAMDLDLSISLTLGVDDLEALGEELGFPLGEGALACKLAPLNIALSTGNGWPAAADSFDAGTFENGSLAGAWRTKPSITAVLGDPATCGIIGGFLETVGGLWLANDQSESITELPAATQNKPSEYACSEDGLVGTPPNCEEPEPPKCDPGFEGTPPACTKILTDGKVGSLSITKKVTIKAGKKGKVKVKVTNTGEKSFSGKITLKSNNKQVKVQKSVSVKIAAGSSVTKTINVSTTKKAKGKANITASIAGKKATAKVTVKKAAKKKKKKNKKRR